MIYFIPLENLEERYTALMNNEIKKHIKDEQFIYPKWKSKPIKKGQFLDIERTIEFKSKQLILISKLFQKGKVKNGDWFFFADIFFPGIESVKYQAELQNIDIKIAAFNHAGRADANDFVQNLNSWADSSEQSYHDVCDIVFVGSNYQKNNIKNYFKINESKIKVTGCVWNSKEAFKVYPFLDKKEDIVIWPHRVSNEKGINDLIDIANLMPDKSFVITSSGNKEIEIDLPKNIRYINNLSKSEYYSWLSKSKYYLSTAYQETFGYTLREALLYNCFIVAPNDLCYPEQLPKICLYDRFDKKNVIRMLGSDINIQKYFFGDSFDNNALKMLNIIERYDKN
jgi:glycosyltransferase involved in cell wall biosynthesis